MKRRHYKTKAVWNKPAILLNLLPCDNKLECGPDTAGTLCSSTAVGLPQGPHSHILMTGGSDRGSYFIPKKIPTSEFVYPKKSPLFFSIPKKIPQCFCISKFYYLSSGKLKHANFNFGFGQKQNYKLRLCYFWFELMKNTIPKKIPVLFSRPKKIPASFIDPKKSLLAKMSDPKKSFGPPRH